jgi:8-oxo-dGTP diphosphatase
MTRWTDRHTIVPAVYLVLRKGDQILYLQRANTGYRDGYYSLPAGHLNGGESALTAMIREAQEEIGITIQPQDLRLVHLLHRMSEEAPYERFDLYFEAATWQGEPHNMEPHKCSDLRWAALDTPPAKTIPMVRKVLQRIAAGTVYSDHDFR